MTSDIGRRPAPNPAETVQIARSDRRRLAKQLVIGAAWLALWALFLSVLTGSRFLNIYAGLTTIALGSGGLAAFWMVAWASRSDARINRFSIASLFLLTLITSVFLGSVRWLVIATGQSEPIEAPVFLAACASSLIVCLLSIPIVLGMLDSLAWMSVWLLRRPWVRRVATSYRASAGSQESEWRGAPTWQ